MTAPDARTAFVEAVDDLEYRVRCETMDNERGMQGRFAVTPEQVDAARQRVMDLYDAASAGEVYPVESVEWGHPATEVEPGTTRITVRASIGDVGAGDTIEYRRVRVVRVEEASTAPP